MYALAIDEGAFARLCMAEPVLVRVVNPPCDCLPRIGQRDDDPERFLALREVGCPIERVVAGGVEGALSPRRVCRKFLLLSEEGNEEKAC